MSTATTEPPAPTSCEPTAADAERQFNDSDADVRQRVNEMEASFGSEAAEVLAEGHPSRHEDAPSTIPFTEPRSPAVTRRRLPVGEPLPLYHAPGRQASRVLRNVPYTDNIAEWNQQLDIYLPPTDLDYFSSASSNGGSTTNNESTSSVASSATTAAGSGTYSPPRNTSGALPVIVHVHGGGWARGDRTYQFYGAPQIANAYAGMGFISVAIGYRLQVFEHFMRDVAAAIQWVRETIHTIPGCERADTSRIVLSGHSAGAHILSLLLSDPQYFDEVGFPFREPGTIRGVVLLSGVYTLKNPFSDESPKGVMNWGFQKWWMSKSFTSQQVDLNLASPTWRLAQYHTDSDELLRRFATATELPSCSFSRWWNAKAGEDHRLTMPRAPAGTVPRPFLLDVPLIVASAESDLGLETDHERLVAYMRLIGTRHPIQRLVVPGTHHNTICKSDAAHSMVCKALLGLPL